MRRKGPVERLLDDDSGEFDVRETQAAKNARGENGQLPSLIIYAFVGGFILIGLANAFFFVMDTFNMAVDSNRELSNYEIVNGRRPYTGIPTIMHIFCISPVAFVAGASIGLFVWAMVYRRRNS